jgi:hypothetical protein
MSGGDKVMPADNLRRWAKAIKDLATQAAARRGVSSSPLSLPSIVAALG